MLENIKVGKKITGGFVVVLAILLLVGIVGYAAINKASKGFAQYRDWAKDANLVGMVQANILMCRMNVKDYMQSASQKDIDEFNEYVQKTDELITDVEKEIQNPERSKLVKQVVDNFKDYKAAFPQVVKLMQQRDQITNGVLRTDGPLAERTLNEIMEATENDGFAELTFIASQAMRHLLLARIYGTQFLDTNSDDAAKRVRQELGLVQQQLDNLSRELKSTTMKNKLNIVQNSVNNYKNSFDELVIAINDRNEIIAGTLDRLGPVFAKDIDDVKLSIKTAQDELGPKLQRSNRNSVLVIILVVILALAIGSSLSLIITKGIIGPVNKINEIANFISRGDLSKEIDIYQKDEIGMLAHAFRNIKEAVQNLINEAAMLTKAAVEGKLDVRGDANKFQGEYRNIVQGVNDTLDAVIGPLNVSAEYIDRISKGDIPARITDEYKGDFNEIKNNLNMCIDAVNGLVAESAMLTEAAVNGKLDVRGDAKKFHGDYRNIVQGVNDTLDAVIGPLNVSAEYIDRISKGDIPAKITDEYRGDFNEIKNNLNMCIDAVNGLVAESAMLTEAAVNGKLDVRGDA
ncbi:MAG: MCP four helix bundle domain-containing protein, partial [Candidatus Marinimicrobia bacterium]|nr:MCP four helix bundle domain-containing protein [Candidatus Neomarinimicrobiota bacterium]